MDGTETSSAASVPAILDYAGPRTRSALRLASTSVLRWSCSDGRFELSETLAGKRKAALAFAFTVFVFLMSLASLALLRPVEPPVLVIFYLFWLGQLVLVLMIVENTWQTTYVTADGDGVHVRFATPLGAVEHRLAADQIAELTVRPTGNHDSVAGLLGELVIRPAQSPTFHLFTDHPERELQQIAAAVHVALGRPVPAARVVQISPPLPDDVRKE